jgi:dCTP deaminase
MILSDQSLAEIWPDSPHIGPASINLHIGSVLWVWPAAHRRDPRIDQSDLWQRVPFEMADRVWVLRPGWRYLAATRERIKINSDLAGQIVARSSWGRDGLAVICGPAGFLDPGYLGNPTLELSVIGSELVVWPGAAICQLILHQLTERCDRPYGHPDRESKYFGDSEPTPSRLHAEVR